MTSEWVHYGECDILHFQKPFERQMTIFAWYKRKTETFKILTIRYITKSWEHSLELASHTHTQNNRLLCRVFFAFVFQHQFRILENIKGVFSSYFFV